MSVIELFPLRQREKLINIIFETKKVEDLRKFLAGILIQIIPQMKGCDTEDVKPYIENDSQNDSHCVTINTKNPKIFQNKQNNDEENKKKVLDFLEKVNTEITEPDNLDILESLIFNPVDIKYILEANLEVLENYYLYFIKEKVEYRVRIEVDEDKGGKYYLIMEEKHLDGKYSKIDLYEDSMLEKGIMFLLNQHLGLDKSVSKRKGRGSEYSTEFHFGRISNEEAGDQ